MQKTAMQQLYDWYMDASNWKRPADKKHYEFQDILCKIESLYEMEKNQIVNAYLKKRKRTDFLGALKLMDEAEKYYNETYKQHNQIT